MHLRVVEADFLSSLKQLLEVKLLRHISHNDDTVGLHCVQTMTKSSQISRGIAEATIRLLNNHWRRVLLADLDNLSAITFNDVASLLKLGNQRFEQRVVEALTDFLEANVHSIVKLLELFARAIAEQLPAGEAVLVTRLKLHNILVSLGFELGVRVKSLLRILIEGLQIRNIWRVREEVREVLRQLLNEHTKLGAPVTDVIYSVHLVAEVLEDSANTVALDGATQVTNMHVLGDVGT